MPSDIQLVVRFKDQGIFAGEEVQSIITFTNVARASESASETRNRTSRGWSASGNIGPHSRPGGPGSQNPRLAAINTPDTRRTPGVGHKTTASLSIPPAVSSASRSSSRAASPSTSSKLSSSHPRSVSIISLGSPAIGNEELRSARVPPRSRSRTNHGRSTSVQGARGGAREFDDGDVRTLNSPQLKMPIRQASPRGQGVGPTGRLNRSVTHSPKASYTAGGAPQSGSRRATVFTPAFQFPSAGESSNAISLSDFPITESDPERFGQGQSTVGSRGSKSTSQPMQTPSALASSIVTESNRSSGESQFLSNHSQETLASEKASNAARRPILSSPMVRQRPRASLTTRAKQNGETLLMGYAQVNANFILDGSLVDRTPFDEVKGKGFLGGQGGGGVVGVKTSSTANAFLGAFNLNSLGESLGGFLGGTDMSSTKEMKGVTSSRAIPLLSTPQSLLFIDLTLLPGEEKSFLFRCPLPKGLPASYRGKAIKISYHISVGVQGAPGDEAVQAVRRVNIPFKVFSGVNDDGEIFGHDLMQPYVILKDRAHTEPVPSGSDFPEEAPRAKVDNVEAATQDFLSYVDTLLNKRHRRQSSCATLETTRGLIKANTESKAKDIIDSAIYFSKQSTSSQKKSSRFEIARNGRRVATISLERTLHRLGESVTVSVDLSKAQWPCYSLRCSLETTERVNPTLALRSAASITRLSRKIYQSQAENTLYADRVVFNPSIPISAAPTLITSGVNLDWALRFEFITARLNTSSGGEESCSADEILEVIASDSRGSTMAAVETLYCETFEVSIPIVVYGETIGAEPEAEGTIVRPI